MSSVGEDFPIQLGRVRELLCVYRQLGPPGAFGASLIESTIRRAEAAWTSGDVVAIIRSYQELKECE